MTPNRTPNQVVPCIEVLSVARGDAHDSDPVRDHLAACAACRGSIREVRSLARAARLALEGSAPAASPGLARAVLERARRERGEAAFRRYALATAAALALVAAAGVMVSRRSQQARSQALAGPAAGSPSPAFPLARDARLGPPAQGPFGSAGLTPVGFPGRPGRPGRPVVLEMGRPSAGRLPFVLEGPAGSERGELDVGTDYVLDTVPDNAVVVDTF